MAETLFDLGKAPASVPHLFDFFDSKEILPAEASLASPGPAGCEEVGKFFLPETEGMFRDMEPLAHP